jgi:hypothetical protein
VSRAPDIVEATTSYERWRRSRIPVVEPDLERKHERMAASPFLLLRGTYYRFLQQFEDLEPAVSKAPAAVAVADLHIENFGTWRDHDARLVWGINDYDEVDIQPYTIDLVRLATSAVLAIRAEHLRINPDAACAAIMAGWREQVDHSGPLPFVLAERHSQLLRFASEAFESPLRFARGLDKLPAFAEPLPRRAERLLEETAPWNGFVPSLHARTAGVGSLGSRRIVARGVLAGGLIVREAKQIPGPASMWLHPNRKRPRGLPELIADARGAAADPWRRQTAKWVVRPLAPDATRLDLASLRRKHDEEAVLRSTGAEAGNVHLTAHPAASGSAALRRHADRRPADWLRTAAEKMAALTERDYDVWREHASR